MSTDARKVYNVLRQRGIEYESTFGIELSICKYYPNHVIQVIERVFPQDQEALERAKSTWLYFGRPIEQMLASRSGAARPEAIEPTDGAERVYDILRTSLLLSDFGFAELRILTSELPALIGGSLEGLYSAIGACKRGDARNIYYLRGVLSRESQITEGKKREATEATMGAEARAWTPPKDYDKLDAGERAEVDIDWQDRLREIELNKAFDNIAKITRH